MKANVQHAALDLIREVTDEEVAFYRVNGWVRLEGLVGSGLVERMLARAQARMGEGATAELPDDRAAIMTPQLRALWNDWQNPGDEDAFFAAVSQSTAMARFGQPPAARPAGAVVGDAILCKLPSSDGGSPTPWHQDFPYLALDRIGLLKVWVALVDMPAEMGTMRFLDGSHRLGPMGRVIHRTDGKDLLDLHPWIGDEHEVSGPFTLRAGDATRARLDDGPRRTSQ